MRKLLLRNCWLFRREERGQALVLFAAGLAAFLGIVGLSVDVGLLVYTRTDLQKAADAAALAGSHDLPNTTTATASADNYVNLNSKSATIPNVAFSNTQSLNDTIQVTATRHIDYFFLKAIGLSGTDVSATAKVTRTVITGYNFPTGVFPYTVWAGNPGTPGPGAACPYGLCTGTDVVYRDVNYSSNGGEVANAAKNGPNATWQVTDSSFKGFFHNGTNVTQIDPNQWQTFSNGGTANGSPDMRDVLHEYYVSGTPIIIPVITAARTCNGSSGINCDCPPGLSPCDMQFKIAAWVAIRLTNDPRYVNNQWTGTVVGNYAGGPPGSSSGSTQPPPSLATLNVKMIQ